MRSVKEIREKLEEIGREYGEARSADSPMMMCVAEEKEELLQWVLGGGEGIEDIYNNMLKNKDSLIRGVEKKIDRGVKDEELEQDICLTNGYIIAINHVSQVFEEFILVPPIITLQELKDKKNLEKSFNRVYDEIKEHISNTEIMEHMDAIKEILER